MRPADGRRPAEPGTGALELVGLAADELTGEVGTDGERTADADDVADVAPDSASSTSARERKPPVSITGTSTAADAATAEFQNGDSCSDLSSSPSESKPTIFGTS